MNWGTWANPGAGRGTFSFGRTNATQDALFENQPDVAYQQFTDWFGGGNPGFNNTVLGRWLQQQQTPLLNRFLTLQAANPAGDLTWQKYLEQQSGNTELGQQFAALPAYMRGANAGLFRNRRELW